MWTPDTPINVLVITAIIDVTLSPLCPPLVSGHCVGVGVMRVLLLPPLVVVGISTAAGMATMVRQYHLHPNLLTSLPCHIPLCPGYVALVVVVNNEMGMCWPGLIVCVFTTSTIWSLVRFNSSAYLHRFVCGE
jgi:hypothetical protein